MAKKRTKAERAEAARKSWERRRKGLPPLTKQRGKKAKQRGRLQTSGVPGIGKSATLVPVENGVLEIAPGYETLHRELMDAYLQSAHGKGKVRHANGRSFDRQPILELARLYGPGFAAGQAAKKTQEALGMLSRGEKDKALAEVHGAIVYLAATAIRIREG